MACTLAIECSGDLGGVVAGRMNWDRVRSETTLRDRGGEPSGLSSGRPARKPATAEKQRAALVRYTQEFGRLEYGDQLAYLGTLRRRLDGLLGSDEKAAEAIVKHFKPLLKKPKATRSTSEATKAGASQSKQPKPKAPGVVVAGATTQKARAVAEDPRLSAGKQRAAILDLVARRPGRLSQKLCVSVLLGEPVHERALRQDPRYGSCSDVPKTEITNWVRQLVLCGALVRAGGGGTLSPKRSA